MNFQTLYNPFPNIPVEKDKESEVVPDQSYTPREIIAKFSRGEKVPLGFEGLYDSEDERLDDPNDRMIFEDDPTRDLAFDFGDYVEETHALEERQREAKQRSKVKRLAESKRKASADDLSSRDERTRETTSVEAASAPTVQEAQRSSGQT